MSVKELQNLPQICANNYNELTITLPQYNSKLSNSIAIMIPLLREIIFLFFKTT